jgi:hypothetical protein
MDVPRSCEMLFRRECRPRSKPIIGTDTVPLACVERDSLLIEYESALRSYVAALQHFAEFQGQPSIRSWKSARIAVQDCREKIGAHCAEHGCDADWLKLSAE